MGRELLVHWCLERRCTVLNGVVLVHWTVDRSVLEVITKALLHGYNRNFTPWIRNF